METRQRNGESLRRCCQTLSTSGHVVDNVVLGPHCAPLRSATISIGRAHLSLVRQVVRVVTIVSRRTMEKLRARNTLTCNALQKRRTLRCTAEREDELHRGNDKDSDRVFN